jgi:ABC-type multidrug transport system fused ATPase/permease subunit
MKNAEKPKYNLVQNVLYLLQHVWAWDRFFLLCMGINVLSALLFALGAMFLPKAVLSDLEQKVSVSTLLITILLLSGGMALANGLQAWSNGHIEFHKTLTRCRFSFPIYVKALTVDYQQFDTAAYHEIKKKAYEPTGNNDSALEAIWPALIKALTSVLGIFTYAAILFQVGWWIALLAAGCAVISFLIRDRIMRQRHKDTAEWVKYASKPYYLNDKSGDYHYGKDIRMFSMGNWFHEIFDINIRLCEDWQLRHERPLWWVDLLDSIFTLCREGIAYAYLIYLVLKGQILASDFVLYFAAIAGFSTWVLDGANQLSQLIRYSNQICDFRAMLELPDVFRHGSGETAAAHMGCPLEIRLQDVSYRYPGAQEDTISHLNLTIHAGEKLAIVGLNGAGKTTLVKLICGLLDPTEGTVFCNGIDVKDFDRQEYYAMFSAVFQDFYIPPLTIAEAISCDTLEHTDFIRVSECLALAELTEKIRTLPKGIYSTLVRDVNEDAVELSGGETQRLILARALYKKAPMVILDEPTAALDPIAEHQLYQKYHEMTQERTSVYISHRLSSTRFCDRILYLEKGVVAEEGSHRELITLHGKYYDLFEVQSHYYRNQPEGGAEYDS